MTEQDMAQVIFTHITKNYFLSPSSKLFARVAAENAAREITVREEQERLAEEQRPLRRARTVTVKERAA